MTSPGFESYLCSTESVLERISQIDPQAYEHTRNFLDGSVTWLSPFVTHGITNTTEIADLLHLKHDPSNSRKLLYELAWREYFHRTWQRSGDRIFGDMRNTQPLIKSKRLPEAVIQATTGIKTIDQTLQHLYSDGLMHNHARMWVASIVCNLAKTHWYEAARFLHYHLLDGDLASNTLSWQWVAGTFSHKQ